MGRITCIAALTLLCLHWSDSATPIPSGKQYVYAYTGIFDAKNSAVDEYAAQWKLTAKLVMQANGDDIVMQFKDAKSSLYNGELEHLDKAQEKPIPAAAHHLFEPFVVHYKKNGSASSISYQSDDPLWSLNIKRAIGSIVQIDAEHISQLNGHKFYEETIYGSCEVEYSVSEEDAVKTVSKTLRDSWCDWNLETTWSNLASAPKMPEHFNPTSTEATRTYRFVKRDNAYVLKQIDASANITYQTMLLERSSQQLVQRQVFHLESESDTTEAIDVTKNTEFTSLAYVFDDSDETSGRKPKDAVDVAQHMQDLKDYYKQFQLDFHRYPLVPGDMGINNTLMSIFETLQQMEKMDLTTLSALIDHDQEIEKVFVSMLPYIGSTETIKLIRRAVTSDSGNDLQAIRLLATFPQYVDEYSPEFVESMEEMMKLKVSNRQVRYAGILNFATVVAEANGRADIPAKQIQKYLAIYDKAFREATDYEDRMTYLLGLINMATLLDSHTMIPFITDKKQSHHLRSLAAYGFKPFLSANPEKLFETLWPIVKDHEEHFEVRVAVLDLLMSVKLSQEEFNTILDEYKKETSDVFELHLQNYLSTTIDSLSNETMYSDHMGAMATESLSCVSIPSYYEAWATGNYRLAYTDSTPNFGSYFQTRLVANPVTNAIQLIQLSFNQFAMSMNLGTYTAYIKVEGLFDTLFAHKLFSKRPDDTITVPELVELLRKFNFKHVEERDLHVEIVLFCDERVVFGIHINEENMNDYKRNLLFEDLVQLLLSYESVSYPKMHVGHMRSDLGTPVNTYIMDTDIISHKLNTDVEKFRESELKTGEWNYRSSRYETVCLQSYNPLVDVNIGVYKYKSKGQRVHLPISVNVTGEYLTFDNVDDGFNLVFAKTVGVMVDDDEKLHEYCSSCENDVELRELEANEKILEFEQSGFELNVTMYRGDVPPHVLDTFDAYESNSKAMPEIEPWLFNMYTLQFYHYFGADSSSMSVRSMNAFKEPTENVLEWDFDIDDTYNENDPINGTELYVGMKMSCRRKQDAKVLSTTSYMYTYTDAPVSINKNTPSHVEQRHKFRAQYSDDESKVIMCFDRELQYPSRRTDVLSIAPVEPAKGKGRISFGTTDEKFACSNDFSITFSDIYEPAKNQMDKVKQMKEYKECKKDFAGLKYTPPTEACLAVHEAVSKYNNYTLYVDLKNAGKLQKLNELLGAGERGFKLLEYGYVHEDVAHVVISKDFVKAVIGEKADHLDDALDFETPLGLISAAENPATIAYAGYDIVIGISTTCDITASKINSFTGKDIEHYESKDGKEMLAYVENFNETQNGMTIQKYSDKKIGFTMWSGDDKLITSVTGDKLKVLLNDNELLSQHSHNEHFKVYFLEDDVLYITNQIVEVYYNTEYISIKAPSLYNNYIVGLCAHENKIITNKTD